MPRPPQHFILEAYRIPLNVERTMLIPWDYDNSPSGLGDRGKGELDVERAVMLCQQVLDAFLHALDSLTALPCEHTLSFGRRDLHAALIFAIRH
jgi:hypothetical protein